MQIRNPIKQSCLFATIVSAVIFLDGLSLLVFGFAYLFLGGIGDCPPVDTCDKRAVIFQGKIAIWLTIAYFVVSVISLIYWLLGKPGWKFVILSIGVLSFGISSCLLFVYGDLINVLYFFKYPAYGLFALNALLLACIIFDIFKPKSMLQNGND